MIGKKKSSQLKFDIHSKAIASFAFRSEHNLTRSAAETFGEIAFWESAEGGRVIKGVEWKWRSSSELALATNYSRRQITRALKELQSKKLIDTMTYWDPRPYKVRVNFHRLTDEGNELRELAFMAYQASKKKGG